ncbi:MAG: hypothetical protein U0359_19480 [Byssovorax sp.]
MRLSNVILGLTLGGLAATSMVVGCGDSSSSTSTSTTSSSSSTSSSSGGDPCSPTDAVCTKVSSDCIALEDYSASKTPTLRMAQLTMTKPDALAGGGVVPKVVANAVTMNLPACFQEGGGTFSWLLQFDLTSGKLTTGGAKPVDDPTAGYKFVNEMISQGGKMFNVAPIVLDAPVDASGNFAAAMGVDLLVPIFLDAAATQIVLLPLKKATLKGTLSSNNNCIGKYNSDTLSQDNNCLPDSTHPAFTTGAQLDGYITLEDADTVELTTPPETLCVLLSGDADKYGDGSSPVNKCKRTNGKIDFGGDWCDATNMAADANCADAVKLGGEFAANAVKLNQ